MSLSVICGRYGESSVSGPADGRFDWVEISDGTEACVFPAIPGQVSFHGTSASFTIEGDLPCIIRSGRRELFSKAIETAFHFVIVIKGGAIAKIDLEGKARFDPAGPVGGLAGASGKIGFSEYFGTPVALALGLVIEDRDRDQHVSLEFRRDSGGRHKYWPRFTRTVRPVRTDQVLRCLRFLIRSDRIPPDNAAWELFQEPSADLLNKWYSASLAPSWTVGVAGVPFAVAAQSILEQDTTAFGESVRGVEGNQPLTTLPLLVAGKNAPTWILTVTAKAKPWRPKMSFTEIELSPEQIIPDEIRGSEPPEANAQVAIPQLRTHNGSPLTFAARIYSDGFSGPNGSCKPSCAPFAARRIQSHPGIYFFAAETNQACQQTQEVRVGAFDLAVSCNRGGMTQPSWWKLFFNTNPNAQPAPDRFPAVEFRSELRVAINAFAIEGQDDLPNESGCDPSCADCAIEPPVMVPLGPPPTPPIAPPLLLVIDETANRSSRHQVEMHLLRASADALTAPSQVVILDSSPFLVAKVDFRNFINRRQARGKSAEIARWSRNDASAGGWKLDSVTGGTFQLILPPQSVGEQMVKRKEFDDGSLLDYRLSPAARLTLFTATERTAGSTGESLDELPTNLRRVLGYAGQANPGVPMTAARFELLYGLQTDVTWSLRIAELGAQLGAIPAPISCAEGDKTASTYATFWRKTFGRYNSRLAALQVWDPLRPPPAQDTTEPVQGYSLGEITADQGLHFTLRHRPFSGDPRPETAADTANPFDEKSLGLKGGAEWGCEFRATYGALGRNRTSDFGEIRGLHLSSLGATGFQKALFANKKIIISSMLSVGDVFYYTIEEIGRVGCFLNRAKHVVVYERTVWPSMQFYRPSDNPPYKDQNPLYRRAIVRKILEYIEITQPKREYPDFTEGSQTAALPRGFVLNCSFPKTTIRVNSQWGSDIMNGSDPIGFQIPLWRPGENATVYPRPSICVGVPPKTASGLKDQTAGAQNDNSQQPAAAPGLQERAAEPRSAELKNPENVFFYSLVGIDTLDDMVDQWPCVGGVDYPLVHVLQEKSPDSVAGDRDRKIPDAGAIPLGARRFTHELSPIGERIDVVTGRKPAPDDTSVAKGPAAADSESSMGAYIRNITVTRAVPAEHQALQDQVETDVLQLIRDAEKQIIEEFLKIAAQMPAKGIFTPDLKKTVHDALIHAKDVALADVKKQVSKRVDQLVSQNQLVRDLNPDDLCKSIKKLAGDYATTIGNLVGGVKGRLHGVIDQTAANYVLSDEGFRKFARQEIEKVFTEWRTESAKVAHLGAEMSKQYRALQGKVEDAAKHVLELVQHVADAAHKRLAAEQDRMLALVEHSPVNVVLVDVQRTIASVRNQLANERDDILTALSAIDSAVAGVQNSLLSKVAGDVRAAVADTEKQIQATFAVLDGAISSADSDCEASLQKLEEAKAAIQKMFKVAQDAVDAVAKPITGAIAQIQKVITDAEAKVLPQDPSQTYLTPLLAHADQAVELLRNRIYDALDGVLAGPPATVQTIKDGLDQAVDRTAKAVTDTLDPRAVDKAAQTACDELLKDYDSVKQGLIQPALDAITSGLEQLDKELDDFIGKAVEAVAGRLDQALAEARRRLEPLADQMVSQYLKKLNPAPIVKDVNQAIGKVFNLVRAFGEVPSIPQLEFNCRNIGYYFGNLPRVDITPVTALVNRVGDGLKALGMTLPTSGLLNRILPNLTVPLNFNAVMRDLGGLDLGKLLPSVPITGLSSDYLHTQQGLDPQTRRGWMKVYVSDMPVPEDGGTTDVFNLGFVNVQLHAGKVNAQSSLTTDGRSVNKAFSASVTGDWLLGVGGLQIVTFQKTQLLYDESGHLHFDISPDRVQLNEALSFITELINTFQSGTSGFSLEPLMMGSLPSGVRAKLDLPMPPLGGLTTGIRGLYLGAAFELHFLPEFVIGTRFFLGQRTKPFVITIFILGGGGWIDVAVMYHPTRSAFYYDIEIGLALSASLEISLAGIITGGVGIAIGANLSAHFAPGGTGDPLEFGVFILIWGEVDVLGLISAAITLRLSATYAGGVLTGTGELKISIKICWCFSINIDKIVSWSASPGAIASVPRHPAILAEARRQRIRPSGGRNADLAIQPAVWRGGPPVWLKKIANGGGPVDEPAPAQPAGSWSPPPDAVDCVTKYLAMLDE